MGIVYYTHCPAAAHSIQAQPELLGKQVVEPGTNCQVVTAHQQAAWPDSSVVKFVMYVVMGDWGL